MPRTPRMIVKGETAVYHVISRTALNGLPIKSDGKDFMFTLVKRLSRVYVTEVIEFTIMSNHLHIICRMVPEDRFLYKTKYFTDSGIIGSRAFVLENFERFRALLGIKNDQKPERIKELDSINSMRRLE